MVFMFSVFSQIFPFLFFYSCPSRNLVSLAGVSLKYLGVLEYLLPFSCRCPFLFSYILCVINSHHWSKLSIVLDLHDNPHRWLHARHSLSPCARYRHRTNARINAVVVHCKWVTSTLANVYNILEKSKEIGNYFWGFCFIGYLASHGYLRRLRFS